MSLEAKRITSSIKSHEERDSYNIDIMGAYLKTELDEVAIMIMKGLL